MKVKIDKSSKMLQYAMNIRGWIKFNSSNEITKTNELHHFLRYIGILRHLIARIGYLDVFAHDRITGDLSLVNLRLILSHVLLDSSDIFIEKWKKNKTENV